MSDRLLEQARQAALMARDLGATDARVLFSRSRKVEVEWRDGKLDRVSESTKQGLSLSLFVEGRYSGVSTSDMRPEAVRSFIERNIAAARYLARDEHRKLPDPARYEGMTTADLELVDPRHGDASGDDRLRVAALIEEAVRAAEGAEHIVSVESAVSDSESRVACVTTNGFEATEAHTYTSRMAYASTKAPDGRKPGGWDSSSARFREDLAEPGPLGAEALKRAVGQFDSRQVATGRYGLILENRIVSRFLRHLMGPLSGSAIQQKQSFMEGKLGQAVASPRLSITDAPHIKRGLSSTAWDGEGMVTTPRPIFDKGVLKTYFLDTYYGSKLGMTPTTAGSSNLDWALGERELDAMVSDLKEGILVTDFLGGNSNSTTGDFSLGINGFYVKDGVIVHPVSEMNMAGNHLAFWKQLVEVGKDPYLSSSTRSPSLRFEDVQCSGA